MPPPPPVNGLSSNEDGDGGAPAPTVAPAKKPWSKPVIINIEDGILLNVESGPTSESGETFQYYVSS